MDQQNLMAEILERRAQRQDDRRRFLKNAGLVTAAIGGSSLLYGCGGDNDDVSAPSTPTPPVTPPTAPAAISDADVLNFALNLEYLEANFYAFVTTGMPLDTGMTGGTGTQGKATGGRKITFSDTVVGRFANEIAFNERAHVMFLRDQLGSSAIAQPTIDLGTDPAGAFSSAARSAGLIKEGESFDPYASDENFLLASFLFEEVGVTAYKGSARLLTSPFFIESAAGILATEAYQGGFLRTMLYRKGMEAPSIIDAVQKVSDARDSLDGSADLDQGLRKSGNINLVPTDSNSIVFGRTAQQVLNIAYLTNTQVAKGGFFPDGANGTITTSAAS